MLSKLWKKPPLIAALAEDRTAISLNSSVAPILLCANTISAFKLEDAGIRMYRITAVFSPMVTLCFSTNTFDSTGTTTSLPSVWMYNASLLKPYAAFQIAETASIGTSNRSSDTTGAASKSICLPFTMAVFASAVSTASFFPNNFFPKT